MNKLLKTYNFSNFKITKGNGSYLYTSKNEKLLDFSAGVAVNSLGYNHPIIKKSLQDQIKTGISHLSGSQIHEFKIKLSELLSKESNKGDVFFSNSGAESIEAALKIARNYGSRFKKDEIIAMTSSFHGRTIGALSVGSNKNYKSRIGPVPGKVKFCEFNNSSHLKKLINKKTVAIIIEFVQGDGGINICTKEFAKTIKEICKKRKFTNRKRSVRTNYRKSIKGINMKLEVLEIKENEDGTCEVVFDYDDEFVELVKEQTKLEAPTEEDISAFVVEALERGMEIVKQNQED